MSYEKPLQEMIQRELETHLRPLHKSLDVLAQRMDALQALREVIEGLSPLLKPQGREKVLRHVQQQAPAAVAAPVAPARAQAPAAVAKAPVVVAKAPVAAAKAQAPAVSSSERSCAVMGCKRPARSKGYCSAHYQKLRLLIRTNRRPADWMDDAKPQSAREMKLPRGRAAAMARPPEPVAPKEPPKPKAWVRRKGAGGGMVSLN